MATEALVKLLANTKLHDKKVEITRTILGSYSWGQKGKIYIPGYPSTLKRNFLQYRVGTLRDDPAPLELGHANEFMHHVYFEPVQEVLAYAGKSLSDYQILTDRNNLRKIDAVLQDELLYEDFTMFLQKVGNTLVVKRESGPVSSIVGHEFEKAICEPNPFESCHVLVECLIKIPDSSPIKVLVRGEVDAQAPTSTTYEPKAYGEKKKTTSTGLEVFFDPSFPPLSFASLREIKMARELKGLHHFQSWLLGVPAIVHGAGRRSETKTQNLGNFNERFASVVSMLQEYSSLMEKNKIYKLGMKKGEEMKFTESKHPRQWFNFEQENATENTQI